MKAKHKSRLKKSHEKLQEVLDEIDEVQTEMQVEYDDMSEKAQESEKGEAFMQEIENIEDYKVSIQQALDDMGIIFDGE